MAPAKIATSAPRKYELIGASALSLRVVCDHPPADRQMAQLAEVIGEIVTVTNGAMRAVGGHGWLIWTEEGLRRAFRQACEIEQRLTASLKRLETIARVRWGVWVDQYIVPFDKRNTPALSEITTRAIFNFEPDNVVLSGEAVYRTNHNGSILSAYRGACSMAKSSTAIG